MSELGDSMAAAFKIMFVTAIIVVVVVTASVTYLASRRTTPVTPPAQTESAQEATK